ncbi:hypothetical protein C4572_00855 [Candidatus Parcubacteria bacterium]|nr:MAG: hypothetical protein C4572_00855 [Candidatus Parcubacteria bacterium]
MTKKIILITLSILLFGSVGFYIKENIKNSKEAAQKNGNKTQNNNPGIVVEGNGNYEVKKIDLPKNFENIDKIPMPDLDKPIMALPGVDDITLKFATEKIKEVTTRLKANKYSLEDWLILGVHRKTIEDYEEARTIWTYAGLAWPQNERSFHNLGELYGYYLKDYKKAEENYKKALENNPSAIYIYRNFADFYRFVIKDNTKAKAILEQGIAANPGEAPLDLQNLLKAIK